MEFQIEILTKENTPVTALDHFIRTQPVTQVYRKTDGEYRLASCPFTNDWSPERKRAKAAELTGGNLIAFGAFENGMLIGFIGLQKELHGSRMIVDTLHVSAPYRSHGIGKQLFLRAISEARIRGAEELYISACSSQETVAFYRAMGAEVTDRPIPEMVEEEPFDLQMVCKVNETHTNQFGKLRECC